MKKLILAIVAIGFAGSLSLAHDEKATAKKDVTVDKSTNPITGTKTVTQTTEKKLKNADGTEANMKITKKTKMHKDGTVKKSTDAKLDSTTK